MVNRQARDPEGKPPRRRRTALQQAAKNVKEQTTPPPRRAVDYAHGQAAQAEAERTMAPEQAAAQARARAGNDIDLLPYQPTPSINPPRPRTRAAGYDSQTQVMTVKFRDGAVYEYYDVSPREWRNFRRVKSPGKAINRTFNQKTYARRDDLEA